MADSKFATHDDTSLMIKAAAFRAKYRLHGVKTRLRPVDLACHKKNRGGEYPSGLRLKDLLTDIAKQGIVQEEADHQCIAVEEMPVHEILKRTNYKTHMEYNMQQCAKDELLQGLYDEPFNKAPHALLAHNHLMMICRAFLTKQLWRLPAVSTPQITFCDTDGRLSLSLITATSNGEQLNAMIKDGFLCETLSWKMDEEEPDAAVVISTAANEINSAAMRTTEIQAFKTLKGEIIIQMNKTVSQTVCFTSVLQRLQALQCPAVADPDLIELFDFLISNGVGKNSYLDGFLDWANASVNPKKRQLRFIAFAPINKMPDAPLSRIAVAKRAYRGKPTYGYCPNPEPAWGAVTMEQILPLEQLLRFFHVQCKEVLSARLEKDRINLLGQVDIAAAEAFFLVHIAKCVKKDPQLVMIRDGVLKATHKFATEFGLVGESPIMDQLVGKPDWIVFNSNPPEGTPAQTPVVAATLLLLLMLVMLPPT